MTQKGKKENMRTLVLLDAHAILHRAYHALPDFASPSGEPTGALYGVVTMLLKIVEELQPEYVVACFDLPDPTYRHVAYEKYKSGRVKTDDGLIAQIIRSKDIFEAFGIPVYEHAGFEADDILGTIAEQTKKLKDMRVVIASGDMDTLQLIDKKRVLVYTLRKGIKDTIMYDEEGVQERFGFPPSLIPDYKGLRGDPSDNIPGIVGIGEKTATELITNFGGLQSIYKLLKKDESKFVEAGIKPRIISLLKEGEEEAEFSKMLATIRRDVPIAFAVPEVSWRAQLDPEKILSLFAELGFRALSERVKILCGGVGMPNMSEAGEVVSASEIRNTGIALWLLTSDVTNPTLEDIIAYARAEGVDANYESARALIFDRLKERKLDGIYNDIEVPLMQVLDHMHTYGIKVDVPYLASLSTTMHAELESLEKKIYVLAGMEFNINSPKQLGEVLYDTLGLKPKNQKRTATGQRSTRESELEKLADVHEIIPALLRYRELQKLVSTYIDTMPKLVADDGRIHSTFLQAGTTTGRMSSKDPNMQNIPVRTPEGRAIRRAFIAEGGYALVAVDYSQIELRIAAFLSGDQNLIEIFKRGEDVHKGVALRVFGVHADQVTPEMRRRAKVINFGILYGMGVNALRANLGGGTTREEAQEFLNAYFNTFTRLAEYLEETKRFARAHGYTETLFGRRRYFPGMTSSAPFIRAQAERMAINAPIQGTEGDVVRIAMVNIYKYLEEKGLLNDVRLLLQVHDELVFEIKEEVIGEVMPKLIELMTEVVSSEERKEVPIEVEVKIGKNWEEMEKYAEGA